MKEKVGAPDADTGWQHWIERKFAWIPVYGQGTFVWLGWYWVTWPEVNGRPVMASDVLSKAGMASMMNQDSQMYLSVFPYDPRKSEFGGNG